MSVDPLTQNYPGQIPYAFAANNPIRFIDVLGMEAGPSFMDWVRIAGRFIASQMLYSDYSITVRNPFDKTIQALDEFDPSKPKHWGQGRLG